MIMVHQEVCVPLSFLICSFGLICWACIFSLLLFCSKATFLKWRKISSRTVLHSLSHVFCRKRFVIVKRQSWFFSGGCVFVTSFDVFFSTSLLSLDNGSERKTGCEFCVEHKLFQFIFNFVWSFSEEQPSYVEHGIYLESEKGKYGSSFITTGTASAVCLAVSSWFNAAQIMRSHQWQSLRATELFNGQLRNTMKPQNALTICEFANSTLILQRSTKTKWRIRVSSKRTQMTWMNVRRQNLAPKSWWVCVCVSEWSAFASQVRTAGNTVCPLSLSRKPTKQTLNLRCHWT